MKLMESIAAAPLTALALLMASPPSAVHASTPTTAILDEADPSIGDRRHKIDLVSGQQRLIMTCDAGAPRRLTIALPMSGKGQGTEGEVALSASRDGAAARSFGFVARYDMLIAAGRSATDFAAWAFSGRNLDLRAGDAAAMRLDFTDRKVAAGLARFRKLCQF